jgi:hypothetical protein
MAIRSLPRYFLVPPLHATFGRDMVQVIDLSLKGARLELTRKIPVGSRLVLTIETHAGMVIAESSVLWCQIDDLSIECGSDRYMAGILFDEDATQAVGELIEWLVACHAAVPIEDPRSVDRYRISAPLTATFGVLQAAIVDLSTRGARIGLPQFVRLGTVTPIRFQVDQTSGPIEVLSTVVWCLGTTTAGFEAGLAIDGEEERLRLVIHRLLMRDEARIDLYSLRRKFDALRSGAREAAVVAVAS